MGLKNVADWALAQINMLDLNQGEAERHNIPNGACLMHAPTLEESSLGPKYG